MKKLQLKKKKKKRIPVDWHAYIDMVRVKGCLLHPFFLVVSSNNNAIN